jgi:hypothetical protein
MNQQLWHPYAPDQQFGLRGAHDQEVVDAILSYASAHHSDVPITCAVALEAAVHVRENRDG